MKLLLIIPFILLFCSGLSKDRVLQPPYLPKEKDAGRGILKILFDSSDEPVTVPKIRFFLSKDFPETEWRTKLDWAVFPFYPVPFPYPNTVPRTPVASKNHSEELYFDLHSGSEIQISLQAGEYYASMDGLLNDDFSFSPKEDRNVLITFGYEFKRERDESLKITEYNKICSNDFSESYWAVREYSPNRNSCPKIKIDEGRTAVIRISSLEKKWNLMNVFFKIVPGIFFLAPISNVFGYYQKRRLTAEME